jgi:hypothetical protein
MRSKKHLLELSTTQIGYLPCVACPSCGAPLVAKDGQLYTPYQALVGTWMQEYDRYYGYLHFDCDCHLNMSSPMDPQLAGTMRVARVGDAILPLAFVGLYSRDLESYGMSAMQVNAARAEQAVRFLCAHADPTALAGTDTLKKILYDVAGGKSPDDAYELLRAMVLVGAPTWKRTESPALVPA